MTAELRATVIAATILVALSLAGYFVPGPLNWGFHFLGFLPWQYTVLYLTAAAWIFIFVFKEHTEEVCRRLGAFSVASPIQFLLGALAVLVSFALLLRVEAPLLGDSFYLLKNYREASQGISPLYYRDEPLATYYFSSTLKLLGASSLKEYLDAFLVSDLLLGIGFVINILIIARALWKNTTHQFLAFVFLLALPYTQLFLGYVETYPVVLFALSLYLCIAFSYFKGTVPFYLLPPAFLLLALTHYLSGLLVCSLIYATYDAYRRKELIRIVYGYGIAGSTVFILLVIVGFDVEQFSSWVPYSHFLSVAASTDPLVTYAQAYTLFSLYHAVDILNLLLLLGAFPAFMIVWKWGNRSRGERLSPQQRFLVTAIVPVLCFLMFVKFDLGAARDWDVFSPYALIAGILAATMFFTREDSHAVRSYALIVLFTLLGSLFFFYVNSDEQASLKRYASFFDRRTLSHNGFYGASLQLAMYHRERGRVAEPRKIWEAYVALFPDDPRGYQNIINNLSPERNEGDILRVYERWQQHDPENLTMRADFCRFAIGAGNRTFANGKLDEAEVFYGIALRLDPDNARACNNLGSVLAERKEFAKAIAMFTRALTIDSLYADALHNLGEAYIDNGTKERGIEFLRRAARLGHENARKELAQMKVSW